MSMTDTPTPSASLSDEQLRKWLREEISFCKLHQIEDTRLVLVCRALLSALPIESAEALASLRRRAALADRLVNLGGRMANVTKELSHD